MANEALVDLIREMKLRADGMENHLAEMAGVSLGQADVDEGRTLAASLETLDAEQAALKARLKTKTAEINAAQQEAKR